MWSFQEPKHIAVVNYETELQNQKGIGVELARYVYILQVQHLSLFGFVI